MIVIIAIGYTCSAGKHRTGQIVVRILICRILAAQILYADNITVRVISIAFSEFILYQLNLIKPHLIRVMIKGKHNCDGIIVFFCHHPIADILPDQVIFQVRIKRYLYLLTGSIGIIELTNDAKHPVVFRCRYTVSHDPAAKSIYVPFLTLCAHILKQTLILRRISLNGIHVGQHINRIRAFLHFHPGTISGIPAIRSSICTSGLREITVLNQIITASRRLLFQLNTIHICCAF